MLNALVDRVDGIAGRFFARAWPSYALILLIQTKVIWRIWDLRDVTYGDTASYFSTAVGWHNGLTTNIVWSPLYTSFYGSFLWITSDPVMATTLHRIVIVMLAAAGVLFVLRATLTAPLALVGAVWWAILPINFNTLYEVHLFALLPILAAWGLILVVDRPWARGCAVAIIAGCAILVRNEFGLAAAGLLLLCLIYEVRNRDDAFPAVADGRAVRYLAAYGLPLVAAAGLCLLAYWRSTIQFPAVWLALESKHSVNMCQVFAFGYQQRNPSWASSPWLDCQSLSMATFGVPRPSARQMLAANLSATLDHYLWNLGLVGNGLQVLLFNAMSGRVNPDYAPVRIAWYPHFLSALVAAVIAAGLWCARRDWWDGARDWLVERRRAAIAFPPFLLVAVPVVLTQRPRPSYFFYISVIVIAATLASAYLACRRYRLAQRLAAPSALAIAVAVLALAPPYFMQRPSARPAAEKIAHVWPHRALIESIPGRVLLGEFTSDVTFYASINRRPVGPSRRQSEILDNSVWSRWDRATPVETFLAGENVTALYLDPHILGMLRAEPQAAAFLDDPRRAGWQILGFEERGSASWMLLARRP